jgi:hypothetical protein
MIEIKNYGPGFEKSHTEFAKKYWKTYRRRVPEYIYWKFRNKDKNKITTFLLALDGEKVIGQLGLIDCKINVFGKIIDSQWSCSAMVDEAYRGKRVAEYLYDKAHELKIITLGSDPSIPLTKSMKKYNYQFIKGPWKFIFPFNLGEIFRLKGYDNKFLHQIPNPFLLLFSTIALFRKNTFKEIDKDSYLEFEKNKNIKNLIYSVYDKEFIDWRFNEFKDYYPGVKTFGNTDGCRFSGYFKNKAFYITDYYVNKNMDFFSIISAVVSMYKSQNISMIRFMSSSGQLNRLLQFSGFIKFRTRTVIAYNTKDSNLLELFKNKEFYYTYLDSDEQI